MMIRRLISKMTLALLCCAMFVTPLLQHHAQAQNDSTIRVYLARLKVGDTIYISFDGNYMLEGGKLTFAKGTEVAVVLRGEQLVLHTQGIAIVLGDEAKFVRCDGEESASLRINGESGMYEGDLALDIHDGKIRPILHVHVEDYLMGVVPFEMGDAFPLEALKAQAIAARTYALNHQDADRAYDVEDTTNDQAFKGKTTYSPLSEQAVRETEGLVGTFRGKLAQCYYSASNGGQTELGQHMWPVEDPSIYDYMDMRDDPYDLENEASSVRRFNLPKKPGENGVGAALHAELVAALSEQLEVRGFAAENDLIRIDEIISLELAAPKYDEPSRLMTEMIFELKVSVRECTYTDPGEPDLPVTASENQESTPAPTFTPRPTATPAYSPYIAIDEPFTVTLPIFTSAEKAMGLSINLYQNELITVTDIGSAFMIESRRYGHGVGLSQRGAQQMAQEYGMDYRDILKFYYPGMEVVKVDLDRAPLPTIDVDVMATPAPSASPTPRPTLMPVSDQVLPEGAYIALVTNIDDDSSLNLRQEPSLSSDILRRLYKYQRLLVLDTDENGWAHVKTDVIEGYVKTEYLQAEQAEQTAAP